MDRDLTARWEASFLALDPVPGRSAVEGARDDLAGRYGEPHRRYHTLAHIRQVLGTVDELVAAGEPCPGLEEVRWAAWYHDVVYEPGARDNEERSARMAVDALGVLGVEPGRCRRVAVLILTTADHQADSPDARVLVDADLAILAASPDAYRTYAERIRAEYGVLTDEQWRAGRGAWLEATLARPTLFHTPTMRSEAERRARGNLRSELADLARP